MTNQAEALHPTMAEQRQPRAGALILKGGDNSHGVAFMEKYTSGKTTFVGVASEKGGSPTYNQASGDEKQLSHLVVGALKASMGPRSDLIGLTMASHTVTALDNGLQEAQVTLSRGDEQFNVTKQDPDKDLALMGAIMDGFHQAVKPLPRV